MVRSAHSLDYPAPPDWWPPFDIYDRYEQKFLSTPRRNALAQKLHLVTVPRLAEGRQTVQAEEHCRARG
ncbi:RNA ligase family protein [Rhodanobacter lindaniclasticus]